MGGDAALGAGPLHRGLVLRLLTPLGRLHRVVAMVVCGRPVDGEVARGGAADGAGGCGEEHEADECRLDHRREIEAESRAADSTVSAPRHLICSQ